MSYETNANGVRAFHLGIVTRPFCANTSIYHSVILEIWLSQQGFRITGFVKVSREMQWVDRMLSRWSLCCGQMLQHRLFGQGLIIAPTFCQAIWRVRHACGIFSKLVSVAEQPYRDCLQPTLVWQYFKTGTEDLISTFRLNPSPEQRLPTLGQPKFVRLLLR